MKIKLTTLAFIVMVIGLCLTFNQSLKAQSSLDGFNPNANAPVRNIFIQPDGKILINGEFTQIDGVPRRYFARLNPDGSLDPDFNPNPNSGVSAALMLPDGKMLLGGSFTEIGGQPRKGLARLDMATG